MVKIEEFVEAQPGGAIQLSKQASSSKDVSTQQELELDATQWEKEVDDLYVTKSDSSGTPEEMDIPYPQDQQDQEHFQSEGQDIPTGQTHKEWGQPDPDPLKQSYNDSQ